jgi:hypothetical protein
MGDQTLMKKQNVTIYTILVLVLISLGFVLSPYFALKPQVKPSSLQQKTFTVYETIQIDSKDLTYTYTKATSTTTALFVLDKTVENQKKGEGKNTFITSINGRIADDSKHEFWKLVVNGQDAQIGAGSYIVHPNDKILWKIDHY